MNRPQPNLATHMKMAAICRLYDYLYSGEGSRLVFRGFEGEDYDMKDGQVVMREGVAPGDKYTFCNVNSSISSLAMWNPESWLGRQLPSHDSGRAAV